MSGVGTVVRGTGDTELIPVDLRGWSTSVNVPVAVLSPANGSGIPVDVNVVSGSTATAVYPSAVPSACSVLLTFSSHPPEPFYQYSAVAWAISATLTTGGFVATPTLSIDTEVELSITATPTNSTSNSRVLGYCALLSTDGTVAGAINTAIALGWGDMAVSSYSFAVSNWSPYSTWDGTTDGQSASTIVDAGALIIPVGPANSSAPFHTTRFSFGRLTTAGLKLWLLTSRGTDGTVLVVSRVRRIGA